MLIVCFVNILVSSVGINTFKSHMNGVGHKTVAIVLVIVASVTVGLTLVNHSYKGYSNREVSWSIRFKKYIYPKTLEYDREWNNCPVI